MTESDQSKNLMKLNAYYNDTRYGNKKLMWLVEKREKVDETRALLRNIANVGKQGIKKTAFQVKCYLNPKLINDKKIKYQFDHSDELNYKVKGDYREHEIAVYTSIFGNYDHLIEPLYESKYCDYFAITDSLCEESWKNEYNYLLFPHCYKRFDSKYWAKRNVTPIQYKVGDEFALKGKICCGNCNRQLRHERQYGEMVFYCGYKRSAGKFSKCYGGYYREYSVNAKVARAIKTVFYALDMVNQGMQEKQSITVRCVDIEDLEKQAEAIRVEQIKLYESYADGVLLRDAYIEKKKALSEKLAALQDSIRTEKEEQECADELDEEIRALTKQASEKTYIGGLTKECVDAFVSMVYLYDDQTMKIEFNCEDVIRRALEKYGA